MSGAPRLRYVRQYVLAEIGTDGQRRIEVAEVRAGDGDPRALEVALSYLSRAGMKRNDDDGARIDVVASEEVARIAGRTELREAAAFLAGALAATAELARVVGVRAPPIARVPALTGEDERA